MTHFFPTQSPYRRYYHSSEFRRREMRRERGLRNVRHNLSGALRWKFEIGPTLIIVALLLLSIGMALMYLAHFNQVATKGYEMRRLQADRQQLLAQYDLSDMRLAETKTLDRIAHSDKVVHMRPLSRVIFVSNNTALASADRL